MSTVNSYKDLIVWQKSMDLCEVIYKTTNNFPKNELYGLTSQIRRCSVSIPSNIAEGHMRGHTTEYKQFLHIANGSSAELETQLLIALRIGYLNTEEYKNLNDLLSEVMRMLKKLIYVLNN